MKYAVVVLVLAYFALAECAVVPSLEPNDPGYNPYIAELEQALAAAYNIPTYQRGDPRRLHYDAAYNPEFNEIDPVTGTQRWYMCYCRWVGKLYACEKCKHPNEQ